MKKLIFILLLLIGLAAAGQQKQSITWLRVEDITNTRYFIWQGDTIDFSFTVDSLVLLKSDSTLYVTITHLLDSISAAKDYADQVAGAGIDSMTVIDNIIRLYFNEEVIASDTIFYINDSTWVNLSITDTLFLAGDTITGIQKYEGAEGNDTLATKAYVDNAASGALSQKIFTVRLPAGSTVAERCAGAVEGTDYPTGWTLEAGTNPVDIKITHGLGKRVAYVSVFSVDGTQERQLFGNAAYSGILTETENILRVESLATINKAISIYIVFE